MRVRSREIAVAGILLAIGTVLQYFLSMLGTLLIMDVITAFSCLAIILVRPTIRGALAIGIAAGFLSMLIPGSIFSAGNLVSGPAGAYGCYYLYELLRKEQEIAPGIAACSATLVSGVTFVLAASVFTFDAIIARFGNFGGFFLSYIPIIVVTAALNAFIVQALVIWPGRALVPEGR